MARLRKQWPTEEQLAGRGRRVTHCPRGHEYNAENTSLSKAGARACRICTTERSRRTFRNRLYGLSIGAYEELRRRQGDRCAVCGRSSADGVRLGVDHDHATRHVRGLLCDGCNVAIGGCQDSPNLLRAAAAYLERPPVVLDGGPEMPAGCDCGKADGFTRRVVNGRLRAFCRACGVEQDPPLMGQRAAR